MAAWSRSDRRVPCHLIVDLRAGPVRTDYYASRADGRQGFDVLEPYVNEGFLSSATQGWRRSTGESTELHDGPVGLQDVCRLRSTIG